MSAESVTALPGSLREAPRYDLIVIGGGINGAAVAREAALHGLRVVLYERDDLCSGTSAASTRLIHGGLRYLEYAELGLVYESLHERERLLRLAGHLVRAIPFNIPIYADARRGRLKIAAGLTAYDLLSIGKSSPRHRMLSRAEQLQRTPGLRNEGLRGGALYYDALVTYPERLVVELCADAAAHGAEIRTHCAVEQLITEGGEAFGVEYRDASGVHRASAPVIVNAAGPWVDRVAAREAAQRMVGGTRGSHIIVAPVEGFPATALYTEAKSNGRPFFIVPWNGQYLIGTTDERFDGDPANVTATASDIGWLLSEPRRLLPGAGAFESHIWYAYAGVRALPFGSDGSTGAITRKHIVHAHTNALGLYSVIGGKLTTHRALAEDVRKGARARLPHFDRKSRTRERALPGALDEKERSELESALTAMFDAHLARRLLGVYGAQASRLLQRARESAELAMVIGPHSETLVAELEFAFAAQWAGDLTDLLQRRCMVGLGPDRGLGDAEHAAQWLVRLGYLDRDAAPEALAAYRRWLRAHRGVADNQRSIAS